MAGRFRLEPQRTLDEVREEIERLVPDIDVGPFTHNMIGMLLRFISNRWGRDEANRAIKDFGLEAYGWTTQP